MPTPLHCTPTLHHCIAPQHSSTAPLHYTPALHPCTASLHYTPSLLPCTAPLHCTPALLYTLALHSCTISHCVSASKPSLSRLERMQRFMSGFYLRISALRKHINVLVYGVYLYFCFNRDRLGFCADIHNIFGTVWHQTSSQVR